MSGGYDPLNPPVRAGFYNRITAAAEQVALGGAGGIVAVPITGNWGPQNEFNLVTSQREYEALHGPTVDDDHFAVIGALTGTGEDQDGASAVLVHRMTISAAAAAERDFTNTTPAAAINLAAKYEGTLGNSLTVTIRDDPAVAGSDQLLVYLSGTLVESYTYVQTDIADLVSQIDERSAYLDATQIITGVALTAVTGQALTDTAGANGTAVIGDYNTALPKFEAHEFNLFMVPSMTDSSILAALRTWTEDQNATSRRFMLVTGGGDSESMATALTRSALSDDLGDIVNHGYNMWTDPDGTARNSSDMVGYIAGMIAAAGAKRAITFARMPAGFVLTTEPDSDEIDDAINGGLLVFTTDAGGVRCERGITTFLEASEDADHPYSVFSKIKSVRTIHQIENDLTTVTETEWIGKVPNTPQTRSGYVGMLKAYFKTLEDANILKPGTSTVSLDDSQDNTGDTLYPIYGIDLAEAIERVLALGEIAA